MPAADDHHTGRHSLAGSKSIGIARLVIALAQGLLLFGLWRSVSNEPHVWPASVPTAFAPLSLIIAFVPMTLLSGLGKVRLPLLILWAGTAALALGVIGWYGATSQLSQALSPPYIELPAVLFSAAAVFIGHHLVIPAVVAKRWIASFDAYFDSAWKAAVQLGLSVGFTGLFWLLLVIGAGLFRVIGIRFLSDLLGEDWFSIPVTALVFALAVHLTDVRGSLIRGVRTVVLMLLSWLLPVITFLAAAFLLALPFTGLAILWETGNATALVLAASAAIIILINTAYQDGREDNLPPAALQWAVRIASLLLVPLMLIAVWGIALRIGQHGLTPDRVLAVACIAVGIIYAVGYSLAAILPFIRKQAWMKPLELTNVIAAMISVGLILAIFTPVLSPARLSVNDQIARLEKGLTPPDAFDYDFLRFEAGRFGLKGLDRLSASSNPAIAAEARKVRALKPDDRYISSGPDLAGDNFEVWPAGATLPEGFLDGALNYDQRSSCSRAQKCLVRMMDIDGDGQEEALMSYGSSIHVYALTDGDWTQTGSFSPNGCPRLPGREANDMRNMLRQPDFGTASSPVKDIVIGNMRLRYDALKTCSLRGGG